MTTFAPLLASLAVSFLAAAFVFVCLFMMLVILIQKPKGGGLSGAFGGAGGGESSFVGARVGDFLTWLTVGCFVAFLLLAMFLTWTINPTEIRAHDALVEQAEAEEAAQLPTADPLLPNDGDAADVPTDPVNQAVDLVDQDEPATPAAADEAPATE